MFIHNSENNVKNEKIMRGDLKKSSQSDSNYLNNLNNNYQKLDEKYNELVKKNNNTESYNNKLEHEIKILKNTNLKLNNEKSKIDEQLLNSKNYCRKIENKIAMGNKGSVISEINKNLKNENEILKQDLNKIKLDLELSNDKIEKTNYELIVFTRALELKVSEFKQASNDMNVDIKASLLYDIGVQRENMIREKKEKKEI